ncbi:MAG: pectic acid lyase [Candidatus Latescibacteria bacterium]|nr:pectic acid lyase [Candidatus Latescibacterota bacterium]
MHKIVSLFLLVLCSAPLHSDEVLHRAAVETMAKATRYFRGQVATNGGYLWLYQSDFSRRQGEGIASPTTIWVQPPGTPSVGMAFLRAYDATGDTLFLNGAVEAAQALVWGQLASGGWDYRIDFAPETSKKWHYRRDVEQGDHTTGERRNRTTLDDDNTQSALRLLMQVDQHLDFAAADIHRAVLYGLESLLKAQYPNGAWPQRYSEWADPSQFPVKKARYPATWSRQYPKERYLAYYTFNDNAIADVIATMIEAHKIYGDERWRRAAERGGDFIILAQMPDPQPAWAQQYNLAMEPAWARRFEPPAITGGESFGVMQILLELYLAYGEAPWPGLKQRNCPMGAWPGSTNCRPTGLFTSPENTRSPTAMQTYRRTMPLKWATAPVALKACTSASSKKVAKPSSPSAPKCARSLMNVSKPSSTPSTQRAAG